MPSRLEDPVAALDLGIELARSPARMTNEGASFDYAHAVGRIAGTEHSDILECNERRIARVLEPCEHDHRSGLDWTTDVQQVVTVDHLLQLGDRITYNCLGRSVQDQPERALVGVLDHQHDGAPEVRVKQRGPGNEQLSPC